MVRALLDGSKTQTRRVVDWKKLHKQAGLPFPTKCRLARFTILEGWGLDAGDNVMRGVDCPYGVPGDRLWVRETWRCFGGREYEYQNHQPSIRFRAEASAVDAVSCEWRPSIFMPRWACRLRLEITEVRVERLHDISESDAKAEGVHKGMACDDYTHKGHYQSLWDVLNAKRGFGWQTNPWVWVISFIPHPSPGPDAGK